MAYRIYISDPPAAATGAIVRVVVSRGVPPRRTPGRILSTRAGPRSLGLASRCVTINDIGACHIGTPQSRFRSVRAPRPAAPPAEAAARQDSPPSPTGRWQHARGHTSLLRAPHPKRSLSLSPHAGMCPPTAPATRVGLRGQRNRRVHRCRHQPSDRRSVTSSPAISLALAEALQVVSSGFGAAPSAASQRPPDRSSMGRRAAAGRCRRSGGSCTT